MDMRMQEIVTVRKSAFEFSLFTPVIIPAGIRPVNRERHDTKGMGSRARGFELLPFRGILQFVGRIPLQWN
jgi:hypothetical protein